MALLFLSAGRVWADQGDLESTADLDGIYLSLGPVGSAVRIDGAWDSAFGGELSLTRVRERSLLSGLGLAVGAQGYGEREGALLWTDLSVATRFPLGGAFGLSAGATAEIHPHRPPRWGAQATLWFFGGVIPYARLGRLEEIGTFADIGVKIILPALRF